MDELAQVGATAFLAVHAGLQPVAGELVRRHEDRTEREREVLALRRAEACVALRPGQIARRPVVGDGEAADRPLGADHGRNGKSVLDLIGAGRVGDLGVGAEDRERVPEREERRFGALERLEDPHARRREHGWQQVALGERILGVLAGAPAAGEERLERLGGELDDLVAVDPAGPAALEIHPLRAEHAEPHGQRG